MHFDWEKYQSENSNDLVSSESLPHHVACNTSHVSPRVLCEVNISSDKCWLAVVKLVCGQLVEISFLSPVTCQDGSKDTWQLQPGHWIDTETRGIYKYGHCQDTNAVLCPPEESPVSPGQDWYKWCQESGILEKYSPLSVSFPPGSGLSLVSGVRPGQKYELQSSTDPNNYWRVTVTENIGGILGLSYDCQDLVPNTDLHLMVTNNRLYPVGTVTKHENTKFYPPKQLEVLEYPEQVLTELKNSFSQIENVRSNPNVFQDKKPLQKHGFDERMLLAVIDPRTEDKFRVAIVDRVLDEFYFEISLLEDTQVKILCSSLSENIFPISWVIEKKFMAKASLQNMSCSPLSKIAPKHLFKKMRKEITNLEVGQMLEFCKSFERREFYFGQILEKQDSILTLEVQTESGKEIKLISEQSVKLFPPGFAEVHNFKFYISEELSSFGKSSEEDDKEVPMETDSTSSPTPSVLPPSKSVSLGDSSWCPRIYFNHLCYSASFLSKHKLESLPKFIGSGPVRLVIREVLSRLIGASFKSGAVLKKLEIGEDRKRRSDYWLETMKGKSRVLVLQADVEIPSKASQVAGFCREVCQKLSCCPYLFGPQLVGSECPSACTSRPKSDFQADGDQSVKIPRRGRKGRKRQKVAAADKENIAVTKDENEEDNEEESGSSSPSCSTTVTTNTTRDNSPDPNDQTGGNKRRYGPKNWGDILPPSEIKTRGAKLPSFAIQLKVRPSKKDVEELEKLLAAKCEPDSPPRPPSPKLLRSKASSSVVSTPDKKVNGVHHDTDAAFSMDLIPDCEPMGDPPGVWHVSLSSNPVHWTPADVYQYLSSRQDVQHMADKFLEEEIDGEAFLLLNLPTLIEHWSMKMCDAITLSRHLESVKLAFYKQFAFVECFNGSGRGG